LNLRGIGVREARILGDLVVIRLGVSVLHDQELICRQRLVRAAATELSYGPGI
jgi:hypothetical protein